MSVIVLQLTVLKSIWGIEFLSRIINAAIFLWASICFLRAIAGSSFDKNVWLFYIGPGILIYVGSFANISITAIANVSIISHFGWVIPWALYLSVPQLMKRNILNSEILWAYFYYFMLFAITAGLLEYWLLHNGALPLRHIMTGGGAFLAGYFSLFYELADGSTEQRLYACFPEPGTLAMYLIPVMCYSIFYNKYLGLLLFSAAFILADSLGGYISLAVLAATFLAVHLRERKKHLIGVICVVGLFFSILFSAFQGNLLDRYEQKTDSATIREVNVANFVDRLSVLLVKYPMGFPLEEKTDFAELNKDFVGRTFAVSNAFAFGGILAFLGYIAVLLVSAICSLKSLARTGLSSQEKVVFSSIIALLPFVIQRAVVWDSAIFAFLFAPTIIRCLQMRELSHLSRASG
jgi:hypothetical protein